MSRHVDRTHTFEVVPGDILASEWSVTFRSGHGIEGVMLEVQRFNEHAGNVYGGYGATIRNSMHDGREFQNGMVAMQYAIDAGLVRDVLA